MELIYCMQNKTFTVFAVREKNIKKQFKEKFVN